eukprot:symbB.v1.2.016929.t1/scaffold1305.1/size135414/1
MKAFQECHVEAELIYVSLCLFLVKKVPSHGLELSRLETGDATVEEATDKVDQAVKLNEERSKKWSGWFKDVASWKRNDSEEELAIFDSILSQRPDIADAMADEATQS